MSDQSTPPETGSETPPEASESPPEAGEDQGQEGSGSEEVRALRTALAAARKDRADARRALDELKQSQMSEAEKAVAQARDEGYKAGRAEAAIDKAEARFRSLATGKVAELDTLMEHIDLKRFVSEGEVDEDAIKKTVDAFAKAAPATPAAPKYETVRKGPGDGTPNGDKDFFRSVMGR